MEQLVNRTKLNYVAFTKCHVIILYLYKIQKCLSLQYLPIILKVLSLTTLMRELL